MRVLYKYCWAHIQFYYEMRVLFNVIKFRNLEFNITNNYLLSKQVTFIIKYNILQSIKTKCLIKAIFEAKYGLNAKNNNLFLVDIL